MIIPETSSSTSHSTTLPFFNPSEILTHWFLFVVCVSLSVGCKLLGLNLTLVDSRESRLAAVN